MQVAVLLSVNVISENIERYNTIHTKADPSGCGSAISAASTGSRIRWTNVAWETPA